MDPEVSPLLIPIALFYFLCASISLFGNGIMIICFIKERKFNTPCHYLITLTCTADMFHLCGHFVFNFQLFYQGPGTQELCFWLLLPSTIGHCLSDPLLLSMGVDRFLACQFPVFYRSKCGVSSMYLFLQLCFPIIFTTYFNVSSFVQRDPNTLIVCQIPLAMSGNSFDEFNLAGLVVNFIAFIIYFITFWQLKKMTRNSTRMKMVFKSIFCTVIFLLTGWCTVTIGNIVGIHFVSNVETQKIINIYAGIGLNVASCSNAFVFYAINSEYRAAMRRLFKRNAVFVPPSPVIFTAANGSIEHKHSAAHGSIFLNVPVHSNFSHPETPRLS